jgi:hypothetical protein
VGLPIWIYFWLLPAVAADLVVVENATTDPQSTHVTIESYNAAIGACDAAHDPGTWYALVNWDEAHLHARIEIHHGQPSGTPSSVREVDFTESDALEQRQRAVGLIIAAYVLENARAQTPPTQAAATSPVAPPPPSDTASTAEAIRQPSYGVDLALLAGPGLDRGAARFGTMLRGFARPFDAPLLLLVSARMAQRFDVPAVMWLSGSAGLALHLQAHDSPWALETRAELVLQRIEVRAKDLDTGTSATEGAWRSGGQLGLEAHAALSRDFYVFGGAELGVLFPAVHATAGGHNAGTDPRVGWGGLIGLRYAH